MVLGEPAVLFLDATYNHELRSISVMPVFAQDFRCIRMIAARILPEAATTQAANNFMYKIVLCTNTRPIIHHVNVL